MTLLRFMIDRRYHIHHTEAAPTCQFFDGRQAIKGVNITTVEKKCSHELEEQGSLFEIMIFSQNTLPLALK